MYDVVIIGSGLGGLQCAYILARRGMKVCVLEKERRIGGCLQSYQRHGMTLDTGFHYVGGLSEGQPLYRIFDYFDLLRLPWKQMDTDAFDEVRLGDRSYYYANGFGAFAERLAQDFPHQRQALHDYAGFLQRVGEGIERSFDARSADDVYGQSLFARSALAYLNETVSDPVLRQVLSGTSLKMELHPALPLYIFAQINSSYIQSAWRLVGGGQQLVDRLAENVRHAGGEIRTQAEATAFREDDERLTRVVLRSGEEIEARWFVSDIHPAATMRLMEDSRLMRRVYRNRISRLQNTFGMFTVSCVLKPKTIPMLNRNQYVYRTDDLWHLADRQPGQPVDGVLITYQAGSDGYASNIDLLAPISWAEVQAWQETSVMRRGEDYLRFKQGLTDQCIGLASRLLPGLPESIERTYTSTPLTYRDYTGTAEGAAYGIRKAFDNLMFTLLTPKTSAQNLLLTGQNLNLHGILGVSMTSFFTCSALLGETVSPFRRQ
ncbi:MAG: NAD(P)/FAD-dependent oxidoreductase [Paludibacteraceae bacterium]|nr:NAD(P)/FAD-dependent oxidoreductase [Paludibacteraceae bacterium]